MKIPFRISLPLLGAALFSAHCAFADMETDKEIIYKAAGLKHSGDDLHNECDNPVTPKLAPLKLGGAVGEAVVVHVEDSACYSNTGKRITILKHEAGNYRPIFSNLANGIEPLKGGAFGVYDIRLDVPGSSTPVWRWNGNKYVLFSNMSVQNVRMPVAGALPAAPTR